MKYKIFINVLYSNSSDCFSTKIAEEHIIEANTVEELEQKLNKELNRLKQDWE